MKKILLSIFAICVSVLSFANIHLNGVEYTIDTLSMYPAGPGTTYYELRFLRASDAKGRMDAFLLAVDTRNPYVHVEQALGSGKIIGTERPSNMAIRSTTDNKIFFAGSNGDFFVTQGDVGLPVSTTIVNKEYAHTPVANRTARRLGAIDAEGRGITAVQHTISMKLVLADTTLNIAHANYNRLENELVLYNHLNGATTATNAYGTEVQIQLLEGEEWNTTGVMKAKVVKVEQQVGSMPLSKEYAVLSGHGTMAAELNKLNVGDQLTLDFEIKFDGELVNIAQAIGSDNYNQILHNGVIVQDGFWNELHPRTGFGTSYTRDTVYMLVVDGRSINSAGCNTKVLGEMLKHYGAYNAVNWDGGGSSCIYVRNLGQMNNGSDGSERACGNGMFAVADVPEVDNTIASIAPYMPIYSLPRYGVALPKFLGYNKYGVMIDTDVQGVTLSCDPALGEILEDGRFLASGENGGILHAHLGDIATQLEVRLMTSAPIAIRLDSVLCDATHPYEIEVQGTVNNATIDLLPAALTWTSLHPEIATVDETGIVVGVANGSTLVIGELGDFRDTILVNVEIPTGNEMLWDDFRIASNWKLKGSSGFNPGLIVPEEADAPVNLLFTYKSARSPYIQFERDAPIYSRPDTIRIPMTTDAIFSKVYATVRANNALQGVNITIEPNGASEFVLDIPVEHYFGTDVAIWPLHFELVKCFLNTSTEKGERYVTLPGIYQIYGEKSGVGTGVEHTTATQQLTKFLENGQLFIRHNGHTYTILGTQR
ncbi:MAG: phosphodiester glycosidase family protein [Paludibacteraceae bacterium]|nr:phosphodiester glycosidase family protein [Paludibacteraceae bacterium]